MKFIQAKLVNDKVIVEKTQEIEMDLCVVLQNVKQDNMGLCYLFLPSDYPNYGSPLDPMVNRDEYLKEPAKYGVCIYKRPFDKKVLFE